MSGKANVDKVISEIRSLRSKLSEMTPVSPLSNQKRPKTPEPKKIVEKKLINGEEISRNISRKMHESQSDIKEQLNGMEAEIYRKEKIDRGYEEVAEELRALVMEKEKIIKQQMETTERQKREIERLTRTLHNVQTDFEDVKSRSDGEMHEKEFLSTSLRSKKQELLKLEEEVRGLKQKLQQERHQTTALMSERDETQLELQKLQNEKKIMLKQMADRESELQFATEDREHMKSSLVAAESELKEYVEQIEHLSSSQVSKTRQTLLALESQNLDLKNDNDLLRKKLEEKDREIISLKEKSKLRYEDINTELHEKQQEIAQLDAMLREFKEQQSSESVRLRHEIEEERRNHLDALFAVNEEKDALEKELESFKSKVSKTSQMVQRAETETAEKYVLELNALKDANIKISENLRNKEKVEVVLRQQLEEADKKVKDQAAEIEQIKEIEEERNNLLAELQERENALSQMRQIQEEREIQQEEIALLEKEVVRLHNINSTLEREVSLLQREFRSQSERSFVVHQEMVNRDKEEESLRVQHSLASLTHRLKNQLSDLIKMKDRGADVTEGDFKALVSDLEKKESQLNDLKKQSVQASGK